MAIVAGAPRWKTVLFDLDGTLINTIPLIVATFHRTFEHFGVQAPDDEVMKSWIGLTLEDTFRPVAGEDAADEWVAVYRKFNQEMHNDAVAPFPGVDRVLADLESAGCTVGVVTAKLPDMARRGLRVCGLPELSPLVGNGDVERHKPAPDPVLKALELAGVEPVGGPGGAVYVGDAPTDIRAGNAAGVDTVGVTWGAATREQIDTAHPGQVATSMAELHKILMPGG